MSVTNIWAGAVTDSSFWVRGKVVGSSVRLAVSTDVSMSNPTWFGPVSPSLNIASIEATGLSPDTQYHYAFEVDSTLDTTLQGKARTFGTEGQPYSFSFWFASCAGNDSATRDSNHAVFDSIRLHEPTFGVHLGDIHYWDIGSNLHGYEGPPWDVLFRDGYDTGVLGQSRQQDLYRNVPIAYIWDDHDYGPNDSDSTSPSRDEACLTYRERVPHYTLPAGVGAEPIYQTFVCGRVRFILTDGRSERSPKGDTDNSSKRVHGGAQDIWLENLLETATEPLIIWAQPYPWIADAESGADHWGGYTTERAEIASVIDEVDGLSDRLVMISGDMHALAYDTGQNNQWGGFRVLQAAAIDATPSQKGGPYTQGPLDEWYQFGLLTIDDPGGTEPITVTFSGRRYDE